MSLRFLFGVLFLLAAVAAHAHEPSDSYLSLRVEGGAIQGRWDIALRDLENAIGLDVNGDARIVWGEVRTRAEEIAELALAHFELSADGSACTERAMNPSVNRHSDGTYLVLDLAFSCRAPIKAVEVEYALFADLDPQHRGLVRFESMGSTQASVLGGERSRERFEVGGQSPLRAFSAYAREGVWHIWIGIDHILFLVCLLLPTLTRQRTGEQAFPAGFLGVAMQVAKLVTAFTVAHSITLALAALGGVELPSRIVESAIAASVVFVALNNLFGAVRAEGWALAFGFGLVHGLGFASVLAGLGLPTGALVPALLGFNFGVELGQLAIVAAGLSAAFALCGSRLHSPGMLSLGSAGIAAVAGCWLVERVLDVDLLSFL